MRHAPELLAAFVRAGVFILCASALWALLPLQARHALGLGSFGYGILLGCIGAGAVAGAAFLPKVRQKVSNNLLVVGATVLFASVTAVLAHVHVPVVAGAAMILGGIAWIAVMSSFNTAAQAAAPAWARARVLSIYMLVFMGGMAVGSAVWGAVAARFGVTSALTYAALGLMIGIAASLRYTLIDGDELNLAPSAHWPEPVVVCEPNQSRDQYSFRSNTGLILLRPGNFDVRCGTYDESAGVTGPSAGVYFATPPSLVASSKVSLSKHGSSTYASTCVGLSLIGR